MSITFIDWFDVKNKEHLKAYRFLQSTGMWPKDFIPHFLICQSFWQHSLMAKIIEQYLIDNLPTEEDEEDDIESFVCPHCGSAKDPWFDRTVCLRDDGTEGMAEICSDCGKEVS